MPYIHVCHLNPPTVMNVVVYRVGYVVWGKAVMVDWWGLGGGYGRYVNLL
jgi:hypothetical protein